MKHITHQIFDIDNNLIREEIIEVPEQDLETIAKTAGLDVSELLLKVQEYLKK
ncbi:MAG: hypothetical protein ACO3UU_09655 [Minisyncoccia bacterium]